jgi:uncharacterized protein (DUF2252 family)
MAARSSDIPRALSARLSSVDGSSLLDFERATPPIAPTRSTDELPLHHGDRALKGALALATALGECMLAGTVGGHAIFVRELMQQALSLELEMLGDTGARATARALARIVGVASPSAGSCSIEAPGWLWSSVVNLVTLAYE